MKKNMTFPSRVESGVVQFEDDWPGLFLRGDDALMYELHLQEALDTRDPISITVVRGLLAQLRSVDTRKKPRVVRIDRGCTTISTFCVHEKAPWECEECKTRWKKPY
jgi:hypothetical protein